MLRAGNAAAGGLLQALLCVYVYCICIAIVCLQGLAICSMLFGMLPEVAHFF